MSHPSLPTTLAALAAMIDYSVLSADATLDQVLAACARARDYQFASVCVRPHFVAAVADALRDSGVKVCTVISFPLGTDLLVSKVAEAHQAIADGADQIDWVFNHQNVAAMRSPEVAALVGEEVRAIVGLARAFPNVLFKIIIESYLLNDEQKREICRALALNFGEMRFFLKSSTGFAPKRAPDDNTGATVEDVALMLEAGRAINPNVEVKASGGIKTLDQALAMIRAGATRLGMGTSGADAVMAEAVAANWPTA